MRFAIISDTHYFHHGFGSDGMWWNRTLGSRTDEIGEIMIASINEFKPDFVIHCGDLTGRCDFVHFETAVSLLNRLVCPWYAVLGNHDTWYPGVRDAFSNHFKIPEGQCYYGKQLGGLYFIFLDTCCWKMQDGSVCPYLDKEKFDNGMLLGLALPKRELHWLSHQLSSHCNDPVVMVGHAPLEYKPLYHVGTLPDGRHGSQNGNSFLEFNHQCGQIGDVTNRTEICNLISNHKNIRLVLSGHTHINDLCWRDGIAFCQTCSMREYPFEFRIVDVSQNEIYVSTHGLRDPAFSHASLIPERNNYWVAGEEDDRTFVVKLK